MKPANLEYLQKTSNDFATDFHGASIVTGSGKEIPITEQMLQRSFEQLIEAWDRSHNKNNH